MKSNSVEKILILAFGLLTVFMIAGCQAARSGEGDLPSGCPIMTNHFRNNLGGGGSEIIWNPNGHEFLFDRYENGGTKLYIASIEENWVKPLLDERWDRFSNFYPAWAPDGGNILFVSRDKDNYSSPATIYKMNVATKEFASIMVGGSKSLWSPHGDEIAYTSRSGLHVMDAEGNNVRPITEEGLLQMWHPIENQMLLWLGGQSRSNYSPDNLGIVDLSTGTVTYLTDTDDCERDPRWFPKGDRIAYVSLQSNGNHDIFSMKADGTDIVNLTNSPLKHEIWYSLSPNGEQIVYVEFYATDYEKYSQEIYVMDVESRQTVQLTNTPEDESMPTWAPDGNHIAYWSSSCDSGDLPTCKFSLNVMKPDGSHQMRLFTSP